MTQEQEYYYRYQDYRESTGYTDYCGEWVSSGSRLRIRVHKFPVLKHTPHGVQIRDDIGEKRFVRHSAVKRFADATLDRALESFRARKERQQSIYEARAAQARDAIVLAETGKLRPGLIFDLVF